ncbi:hypothetical protein NQZ68_013428, partial [Dissostichus eleginoides]
MGREKGGGGDREDLRTSEASEAKHKMLQRKSLLVSARFAATLTTSTMKHQRAAESRRQIPPRSITVFDLMRANILDNALNESPEDGCNQIVELTKRHCHIGLREQETDEGLSVLPLRQNLAGSPPLLHQFSCEALQRRRVSQLQMGTD